MCTNKICLSALKRTKICHFNYNFALCALIFANKQNKQNLLAPSPLSHPIAKLLFGSWTHWVTNLARLRGWTPKIATKPFQRFRTNHSMSDCTQSPNIKTDNTNGCNTLASWGNVSTLTPIVATACVCIPSVWHDIREHRSHPLPALLHSATSMHTEPPGVTTLKQGVRTVHFFFLVLQGTASQMFRKNGGCAQICPF